jgi:hypothetical protein
MGAFETFLELVIVLVVIVAIGWVLGFLNGIFPTASGTTIYNGFTQFFDGAILFIIFAVLIADTVWSYYNPLKIIGIVNIMLIVVFGYLYLSFQQALGPFLTAFNANSIFPTFYFIFNSGYLATIIVVFLVIDAVINMYESGTKS